MKVDIWMPLYVGDYLKDTQDLTAEEHGIYFLLMLSYWNKGNLPNNMTKLRIISRTSNDELLNGILSEYFTQENGHYKNKRIEEELAKAVSRRESARENGLKGGRPKKSLSNNPQITHRFSEGIPDANLQGNPDHNPQESSSSSSSSSHTPKPSKRFKKPTIEEIKAYCQERKNGIDPQYYFDSNETKGWVVGKNCSPMKDWKANIRTWEKNDYNKQTPVKCNTGLPIAKPLSECL